MAEASTLADKPDKELPRINVLLFSKTGNGKSSLANALTQTNTFEVSDDCLQSTTQMCKRERRYFPDHVLNVVDTPGCMDTSDQLAALTEIGTALTYCQEGFDVVLLVIRIDVRLTDEEKKAVKYFKKFFGRNVYDHCILVFTHGDNFNNDEVKFNSYLASARQKIPFFKKILERCSNRVALVDNSTKNAQTELQKLQIDNLLEMIQKLSHAVRLKNIYFGIAHNYYQSEKARSLELKRLKRECEAVHIELNKKLNEKKDLHEKWSELLGDFEKQKTDEDVTMLSQQFQELQLKIAANDFILNEGWEIVKQSYICEMKVLKEKNADGSNDQQLKKLKEEITNIYNQLMEKTIESERLNKLFAYKKGEYNREKERVREIAGRSTGEYAKAKGDSCFPADAVVQTPNGAVRMDELSVGESVLCMHNNKPIYSTVYMWGHRDHTSWSNSFVTLTTDTAQLTLTSDHLMLIIDEMGNEVSVAAGDVCAGQTVQVLHNVMSDAACLKHEKVVAVERCVMRRGLFAPFTMEGNLVVDDVLASCYINCLPHAVSHGLLWPVRFSWRLLPSAVDAFNELGDDGMPRWVSPIAKRILPRLCWLDLGAFKE